jgi:hypothetical protein
VSDNVEKRFETGIYIHEFEKHNGMTNVKYIFNTFDGFNQGYMALKCGRKLKTAM